MSNGKYEIVYRGGGGFSERGPYATLHRPHLLTDEANFAMALVERWGIVAARPDGEDSAGRQALRDMEPSEVARVACDTAAATFAEFEQRGWFVELPDAATVEERCREARERN